jgi:hypothetical protein
MHRRAIWIRPFTPSIRRSSREVPKGIRPEPMRKLPYPGEMEPKNYMNFSELGLSQKVLSAVEAAGYTTPTPIQAQAIPEVPSAATFSASRRPAPARPRPSRCR